MANCYIKFNTIKEIQDFVRLSSRIKGTIDLVQGKYCVPATSLMGIFIFNLEKPVKLKFDDDLTDIIMHTFKSFDIQQSSKVISN